MGSFPHSLYYYYTIIGAVFARVSRTFLFSFPSLARDGSGMPGPLLFAVRTPRRNGTKLTSCQRLVSISARPPFYKSLARSFRLAQHFRMFVLQWRIIFSISGGSVILLPLFYLQFNIKSSEPLVQKKPEFPPTFPVNSRR